MKTLTLTVALLAGSVLSLGLGASSAPAQSPGTSIFHHTRTGILGSSQHFDYGDLYNNQKHNHHAVTQTPSNAYQPAFRANIVNRLNQGTTSSTGILCPGMVLPDGAIVVRVGH